MKLLYLVESGKSKFLVFDEMPDKISTKYGDDTIIGRIGGVFYDFLAKRNERREAFGGRKFDIVLDNGEIEKCEGQWWDAVTDRAREELEKEGNPKLRNLLEDGEYIPSSWSIKFNGPLYERTKQSIRLCFGISPLLDVVLVQY